MDRRYYTPREVSELLRVSPTTVMKLIHEGRLFAVRVSERIYRIPIGAVRRLQQGDPRADAPTEEVVDAHSSIGEPVPEDEHAAAEV
jgi:excisionase family DNA binding protein